MTKFYEGDVVCIIGPSGSGKSTFLRSLNLLEEVTSGHITVNGYDLTENQPMSTMFVKTWEWSSNTQPLPTHVRPRKYHFCTY